MSEIELKLAMEPKDLSKAQGVLSRDAGKGRPGRRMLTSTYYDTPSFDLKQRDVTLRVRRQGRRFIQTVKTDDLTGRDPLRRGEWENEIGGGGAGPGGGEGSGGRSPKNPEPRPPGTA